MSLTDAEFAAWYRFLKRVKPTRDEAWHTVMWAYEAVHFQAVIFGLTRAYMESAAGMREVFHDLAGKDPGESQFPLEWASALRQVADEVEAHHFLLLDKLRGVEEGAAG